MPLAASTPAPFAPASPLKVRRVFLGMRQIDLAHLSGVSRETVIRLERSENRPTWDTAVKLSRALACDPAELFPERTT